MLGQMLTLCYQTYETLRPSFPEIKMLMAQVPECPEDALAAFDAKITQSNTAGGQEIPEKIKRDMIRKVVKGIIGKTIGQQFKRPVHLRQLPPLQKPQKKQRDTDEDVTGVADLFRPE
uniref:Uncharacterized protein n=2 Tax=Plectus sambesii TaxID=2011161 RepID=A0A914V0T3_9BILA